MQSRGPLMIEHRLIERMIALLARVQERIETKNEVDPFLVDAAVDFIHIYADRTHHGKEEDILFKILETKELSPPDRLLMTELIQEHVLGRKTTRELVEANARYRDGDTTALAAIADSLGTLVNFYPKHIEKEDKVFFPAYMAYLSQEEDHEILNAFWEFDRKMIHEKYGAVVEQLEKL
jgi:hemerythrin-like domain-containing protein